MTRILLCSFAVASAVTAWQFLPIGSTMSTHCGADEPTPAAGNAADEDSEDAAANDSGEASDESYYQGHHLGEDHAYPRQPILFQQYYAQPGYPAGMYPAPIPTPPVVGHVYYTNEAMMPHEFLYTHFRVYYNNYGNYHGYGNCQGYPSYNKTRVVWARGTILPFTFTRFHQPQVPAIPCNGDGRAYAHGRGYGNCNCVRCQQQVANETENSNEGLE